MKFFLIHQFPKSQPPSAMTDFLSADGTRYGDAPRCEQCKQYVSSRLWLPPYRINLETWSRDYADVGIVGMDLVVSRHFKEVWEDSMLLGLSEFDPVEVVAIRRHKKAVGQPPPYFRAVVCRGSAAIDLDASGFEWDKPPTCGECRLGTTLRCWRHVIIDQQSWAGEDVFIARGLPGEIIVSSIFKDLCDKNDIRINTLLPAEDYGYDYYRSRESPNESNKTSAIPEAAE